MKSSFSSKPPKSKPMNYPNGIDFSPEDFKIRASAAYNITIGMKASLTEKEQADLDKLYAKDAGLVLHGTTKKPLKMSDNDRIKLGSLLAKKKAIANPKLSKTAMTLCNDWIRAKYFDQMADFHNKYTTKGTKVEPEAIKVLSGYMDRPLLVPYSGKRKSDEFKTGMIDAWQPDYGLDVKAPYTAFTHPLFDWELQSNIYADQGVVYCDLYDRDWWCFAYVLMDAPAEVIEKECWFEVRNRGGATITNEIYDRVKKRLTYSNQPLEKRIRLFWVKRDDERVQLIHTATELCRKYIHEQMLSLGRKNQIVPPGMEITSDFLTPLAA